jgi:hypothetical protein
MDDKHQLKRQNFMARLFGSEQFEMPQDILQFIKKHLTGITSFRAVSHDSF